MKDNKINNLIKIHMKKVKTMKFLKNGIIRFSVNKCECVDEIDVHLIMCEICEKLTRKFNRIISQADLSVCTVCVDGGDFEDSYGFEDSLQKVLHNTITQIDYDPYCGIVYIDTTNGENEQ